MIEKSCVLRSESDHVCIVPVLVRMVCGSHFFVHNLRRFENLIRARTLSFAGSLLMRPLNNASSELRVCPSHHERGGCVVLCAVVVVENVIPGI